MYFNYTLPIHLSPACQQPNKMSLLKSWFYTLLAYFLKEHLILPFHIMIYIRINLNTRFIQAAKAGSHKAPFLHISVCWPEIQFSFLSLMRAYRHTSCWPVSLRGSNTG